MSPPGHPKGESLNAEHETSVSAPRPAEADRAALTATAAGHECIRVGRYQQACAQFGAALQQLANVPGDVADNGLLRLDIAGALGEALVECDRLDEAEQALDGARALRDQLVAQGVDVPAVTDARLALWAGRIRIWRREPAAAVAPLREAIARLSSAAVGPSAVAAGCQATLAIALGMTGLHDDATRHNQVALAMLDSPTLRHLGKERSRVLSNLAIADWTLGRHAQAREGYFDVLAILHGLVEAGDRSRRIDIGRVQMNLGSVLTSLQSYDEAIAAYHQAIEIYSAEIRRALRSGASPARLRASLASTRMNLGYAHFRAGHHDDAARWLRLALRDYALITSAAPHLHDDEARTRVNLAHLSLRQARPGAAQRGYAQAITIFGRLIEQGRHHLAGDLANAQLGLARALAAQGRLDAAARQGEVALHSLAALTRQGQLDQARLWLQGLRGLADALHSAGLMPFASSRLQACLADAPLRGHPVAAEQTAELLDAITSVASWRNTSVGAVAGFNPFIAAYLRHLLAWVATLLGESDPAWLQVHAAPLGDVIERLREAAAGDGAALLADWFLSTRGLRAQRNALAQSGEPRVRELAALLQQLRRIEEELLGRGAAPLSSGHDTLRLAGSGTAVQPPAQHAGAWSELHRRCDALRRQLVAERLVPPRLAAQAHALAQQLAGDEALFLLARPAASRAVVIGLRRPDAHGSFASATELPLAAALVPFRCGELLALVRQGVVAHARGALRRSAGSVPVATPERAELAEFAAGALHDLAQAVLAPVLDQMRTFGLSQATLVPSDDLHLLPWHLALDGDASIAVYPSVGAWLHGRSDAKALAASHAPRWAVAAWPAAGSAQALPWVEVEHALFRALWRGSVPVDAAHRSADGVDAFIGMGHGRAAQDNPSHAGLEIDAGQIVTAHDLPALRSCRAVVLSCCVLGQTQDVFGEPLGFLSAAFGYDARFGAGWLIEVPDAQACLFGAALQFAWCEGVGEGEHDGTCEGIAWRRVFEATRHGIAQGRWPEGFGAWLAQQLPRAAAGVTAPGWPATFAALAAGSALYRTPPAALRRLMPWVIGLGQ